MSNNLRATNLAFLSTHFPRLAERIENHTIAPGELRPTIASGEGGFPTASVSVGGRDKFLHSKYDPVTEARRWASSQTPPSGAVVMIVGWGLGYHALEWVKAHGQEVEAVILFEPEPELFKTSLFCVDLQPLAQAKRLEIIIGCDTAAFDLTLQRLIEPLLTRDLSLLPLPFVDVYPPETMEFLKTNIRKMMQRCEGILHHMAETGMRCQEQIVRNLPAMADAFFPGDVKGLAAQQPGIIVAAGPSLDRNLHILSQAQGHAWIFAVDTSLRILQKNGIEAQFVVTKDPTERNLAHFEGLQNLINPSLIFDPQISPDIPPRFLGPKICMPNRNRELHRYVEGLQLSPVDSLPHSTNVALAAFNMAVVMGCDPIIFVGLDFCFAREGGASHAADSALRSETLYSPGEHNLRYQRGEVCEDIQVIEVEGIDGQFYPTSPNFYESLRLLESLIQNTSAHCIDASEGGAKIAGTTMMPLANALQSFCAQPIDCHVFLSKARPDRNGKKIESSIEAIADHIERCGIIAQRATEELLEQVDNSIPPSIHKARSQIESGYRLYHELQSALERLQVEISRPGFWDSESQKRKEWLPRYQAYFNQIEEICAHFAPVYREVAQWIAEKS